ncbi:MAG: TIGR04290 family methyltransferase [Actinomycetota bacterium]|nr:TIGR04290 family methyltransferase [Actinomycetota bacterium]
MTRESRGARSAQIGSLGPWFHNLHLPGGVETAPDHPLGDYPAFKWAEIAAFIPEDLSGWTALDIGCNAGFYTFELARRGARVTGIDANEHYLRQARWAQPHFGLDGRVDFRRMQVYDLARHDREYDLVLFMGVLYHLRHPLLALDLVAQRTRRLLVLQTLTIPTTGAVETPRDLPLDDRDDLASPGWPSMAFIEHRLAGDPTNWWAANDACVDAMARSAGLEPFARPGHEIVLCRRTAAAWGVHEELDAVFGS